MLHNIVIGGDFNIDLLDNSSVLKKVFLQKINNHCLNVINTEVPTRFDRSRKSLLDLFLTSTEGIDEITKFAPVSLPGLSDHDLIYVSFKIDVYFPVKRITFRDYKNIDY